MSFFNFASVRWRLLFGMTMITLLASCTPFRSSHLANTHGDPTTVGKARVGQFYFLPRARLKIEGKPEQTGGGYVVTVERILEANPNHRFFLEYRPNVLFNDDIQDFKVNDLGLLTLVTLHTEDQSLQALDEFIQAGINMYKIGSGVPESAGAKDRPKAQPFRVTFDPLSTWETQAAIATAKRSNVLLDVRPPRGSGNGEHRTTTRYLDDGGGVYYHPPTAVGITLDFSLTTIAEVFNQTVTIPDPSVIATYAFKRNAFIKREQSLTLESGMPKEMTLNKPSQMKGFSSGFKTITETVKDAMPDLIKIRVEKNNRKEEKRLQRLQRLEEEQARLSQERARPESASVNWSGGGAANRPNQKSIGPPDSGGDALNVIEEPPLPQGNIPLGL